MPVSTSLAQTNAEFELAGEESVKTIDNILASTDRAIPANDASRIETLAMQDVPINAQLIFIQNEQGDQAVRFA